MWATHTPIRPHTHTHTPTHPYRTAGVRPPGNPNTLTGAASNADGSRLYVIATTTQSVYVSTDGGASFPYATDSKRSWSSIDTDDSGMKVLATAGTAVYSSGDGGVTLLLSRSMDATTQPIVTLAGNGLRAAAADLAGKNYITYPNSGLQTATCTGSGASFKCEQWTSLVAPPELTGASKLVSLDMSADGNRLAVGNLGTDLAYNGVSTYTYGLPTAGAWNRASFYVGTTTTDKWPAVAIADNAASLAAAATIGTTTSGWLGRGAGVI